MYFFVIEAFLRFLDALQRAIYVPAVHPSITTIVEQVQVHDISFHIPNY